MDACKQTHKALCVYGELKRMKTAGGEKTQAFVAQVSAALALLTMEEQHVVQSLYIMQMTQEEAAEAIAPPNWKQKLVNADRKPAA